MNRIHRNHEKSRESCNSVFIFGCGPFRIVPVSVQFVVSSIGSLSFTTNSSDNGSYEWVASQVACQYVFPSVTRI